jgi:hypothetical protein
MGKPKVPLGVQLNNYVREFGKDVLSTDGKVLFCLTCEKSLNKAKKPIMKFQVKQHLETNIHQKQSEKQREMNKKKQTFIDLEESSTSNTSVFLTEFCTALVSADVSFQKLSNPLLKAFLEKYTNKIIPSVKSLRQTYLPLCYGKIISHIKKELFDKKIWISIDETTDSTGRSIGNVIIGSLDGKNTKSYLINCEVLVKCNATYIARLFNDSLKILWPDSVQYDNVLLFLTDAAPYMVSAGKSLKCSFSKMIHFTCMAHSLNRVAETVRLSYNDVDTLISNVKKVFLKAPNRVEMLHELCPNLTLPPKPILTRWGTWLQGVEYYKDNLEKIQVVLNNLDTEEAESISIAQEFVNNRTIKQQLIYIFTNFYCIKSAITGLESNKLSLNEALLEVKKVKDNLDKANGSIGEKVKEKFNIVLKKNPGFKTISTINKILKGEELSMDEIQIQEKYEAQEIASFKFAPITSCDVERSFSVYKSILSDNRKSFLFSNLKMYFVTNCNSDLLK